MDEWILQRDSFQLDISRNFLIVTAGISHDYDTRNLLGWDVMEGTLALGKRGH